MRIRIYARADKSKNSDGYCNSESTSCKQTSPSFSMTAANLLRNSTSFPKTGKGILDPAHRPLRISKIGGGWSDAVRE